MHMVNAEVSRCSQFDAFQEVVGKTFLEIDFDARPAADGFRAEFQTRAVGSVIATLARASGPGIMSAHRDRQRIMAEADDYMVFMMVRGGMVRHTQYGRTADTPPGHMVLIDSREIYQVQHTSTATSLNVRVPIGLLRAALGAPERYCGFAIDGRAGLNAMLSDLVLSAWRRAPCLSQNDEGAASTRVVDAIASLCSSAANRTTVCPNAGFLHFQRAKRYMETRLGDPVLDPAHIAAALRVSIGHLHAVMRSNGTSICKLILNMRLDRCREALVDPTLRNHTITSIAFDWGFIDSAHFSRSFKARFGVTPRQYRCRAGQPATEMEFVAAG